MLRSSKGEVMKQLTEAQLKTLLEKAFVEGWNRAVYVEAYEFGKSGVPSYDEADVVTRDDYVAHLMADL